MKCWVFVDREPSLAENERIGLTWCSGTNGQSDNVGGWNIRSESWGERSEIGTGMNRKRCRTMMSSHHGHTLLSTKLFELCSTLLEHQPRWSSPFLPSLSSAFSVRTVICNSAPLFGLVSAYYIWLMLLPHHNLQTHLSFPQRFLDCSGKGGVSFNFQPEFDSRSLARHYDLNWWNALVSLTWLVAVIDNHSERWLGEIKLGGEAMVHSMVVPYS